MPLPIIIGGVAIAAGIAGVGSGIHGGVKMKEANDTIKAAKRKQETAIKKFEANNIATTKVMDELGKLELNILSSFKEFSNAIEKIQGRPEFTPYNIEGVDLQSYEADELKKVAVGADVLLGGLGGAAAGTAGGFAAASVTTSAVMAFGAASTGTAIAELSGVAATNATLAALGGGSIAVGGGGMALGTAVLGGASLGVGLLIGGIIFNVTGTKLSDKADDAYRQSKRTEEDVDKIVKYLEELKTIASRYKNELNEVYEQYLERLKTLDYIINFSGKIRWSKFNKKEKKMTKNLILLVGLLYKMCQIKLVEKAEDENAINTVNNEDINKMLDCAKNVLDNELNEVA